MWGLRTAAMAVIGVLACQAAPSVEIEGVTNPIDTAFITKGVQSLEDQSGLTISKVVVDEGDVVDGSVDISVVIYGEWNSNDDPNTASWLHESFNFGNESFGNETYAFGNETFGFGNESFAFSNETGLFGNESGLFGNETWGGWNESGLFSNESFWNETSLFSNESWALVYGGASFANESELFFGDIFNGIPYSAHVAVTVNDDGSTTFAFVIAFQTTVNVVAPAASTSLSSVQASNGILSKLGSNVVFGALAGVAGLALVVAIAAVVVAIRVSRRVNARESIDAVIASETTEEDVADADTNADADAEAEAEVTADVEEAAADAQVATEAV